MKKISKYIVVSAVLAFLITVFAVLLILYDKRVFDISFIKRPDVTTSPETAAPPDTDTNESTDTAPGTGDTGAADETTEPADTEPPASVFDDIHASIPALNGRTVNVTEDTYDKNKTSLYRLDSLELPKEDVFGDNMIRTRYSVRTVNVLRTFTEFESLEIRSAADVYMGMLVISDGKSLSFYDGLGTLLYKYEGEERLIYAYERDKEDRPLFLLAGEYYYINAETHELEKSDFDRRDSRGLHYNYPSGWGKSEGGFVAFRNGDKYGIKNAEGETLRGAVYESCYNFSEGFGFVTYKERIDGVAVNVPYYLNEKLRIAIEGYDLMGRRDENGIGSIYFDGGYVMVRKIVTHPIRHEIIEEDSDTLIDTRGNEVKLPEGYKPKAYSDQRVLVEKGGKYGFYAVKGAWIADAVYTYATPYYEGLAVVGTGLQRGVIDMDGNFVIPLSYSKISVCSGGIIVCWSAQTGYEVYIKADL